MMFGIDWAESKQLFVCHNKINTTTSFAEKPPSSKGQKATKNFFQQSEKRKQLFCQDILKHFAKDNKKLVPELFPFS